ncbi:hypothetical protein [uncultured Fibrobacter sp.]|uniref:hypothetical protein n=1 Tax=uncultured Fibrobacter sp. TaxID=261512 RepID=UPI0025D0F6E4|nr:hypothetical protein [uncultured Fibrobacter sp.]
MKQETARAERKAREERLVQKVHDSFDENHRVYGCPKMQAALHDKCVEVKVWKALQTAPHHAARTGSIQSHSGNENPTARANATPCTART